MEEWGVGGLERRRVGGRGGGVERRRVGGRGGGVERRRNGTIMGLTLLYIPLLPNFVDFEHF